MALYALRTTVKAVLRLINPNKPTIGDIMSYNPLAVECRHTMLSAMSLLDSIQPHIDNPQQVLQDLDMVEDLIGEMHQIRKEGRRAFIGFDSHKHVKWSLERAEEVKERIYRFRGHYQDQVKPIKAKA